MKVSAKVILLYSLAQNNLLLAFLLNHSGPCTSLEVDREIVLPANSTQKICNDQFILSNGTCLPQCGKWKQYDDKTSLAVDTIFLLSSIVGFGFGILVLMFLCIWRERM